MEKDVEYYLKGSYRVEFEHGEDGYVVSCPELEGCTVSASSIDEGLELIVEAKRAWFAGRLAAGEPVPEPFEGAGAV